MPPHVVASMLLNLAAANEIGLDAEDVRGVLAAVAPIVRNGPCRVRNGQDRTRPRGRDQDRGGGSGGGAGLKSEHRGATLESPSPSTRDLGER